MPTDVPIPDFERLNLTGPIFRLFLRYQPNTASLAAA